MFTVFKKADKMQIMRHEYDMHMYILANKTSAGLHEFFLFIVSSEAKELLALPKMIDD